ncbi:MAG TPA: hydrolase [Burkholderiales bacterium]|nr:hydrolase [Burkholderiales bacterium]
MPTPSGEYKPTFWLPGGHLQTLYSYFFAPRAKLAYRRERWELPDGDFLDLDWMDNAAEQPLLVVFHGLEGDSRGYYVLALLQQVRLLGWRGVAVNFRGCSGEPNRLPRAYFAGDSAEIGYVLTRLRRQFPHDTIFGAGFSLGANALLLWLGEQGERAKTIIQGAAAISAPMDLAAAGNALDRGLSRWIYTRHFLKSLKRIALQKLERFPGLYDADKVRAATTLREFDDLVTAPLHGYADTDDYWHRASSLPGLTQISVPTLVLNARNDPFVPGSSLPVQHQVSAAVTLDFPAQGGHVGFPSGFLSANDWLSKRITDYLQKQH